MTNVEKLKAYYGDKFENWQIDEAVPREIANHVKRNVDSGRGQSQHTGSYISDVFPNTDLANSSVRELTPQEALEEIKKGNYKNLIYIISSNSINGPDQFVTLRQKDDGYIYGSTHFSTDVEVNGKNKNTKNLAAKAIGNLADHIYFYDNVDKDPELIKLRSENPESPNWRNNAQYDPDDPDAPPFKYDGGSWSTWGVNNRGGSAFDARHSSSLGSKDNTPVSDWRYSDIGKAKKEIKRLEDQIASYKDQSDVPGWMIDRVKTIKDLIKSANNDRKDQLARLRNAESEKSLTKDMQMYKNLKRNLGSAENDVYRAKNDLSNAQGVGSSTTRRTRERLDAYKSQLNSVLKEIARLEMALDDAMENDKANLGAYQKRVDDAMKQVDDIKTRIDKILGR